VPEWRIVLLRPARRYLEKLPSTEQERVLDALTALAEDPFEGDVKPLKGRPEWSLRVGELRALLRVDRDEQTIVVTLIAPRGDVYKR
jgi:mRNA interferase RelE/StbE